MESCRKPPIELEGKTLQEIAREALDEASKETERSNLVPVADDGFLSLWRPLD